MRKMLTVARRELAGYFFSPMAYVKGASFLLAASLWFFAMIFQPGQPATLRPLFEGIAYLMVLTIPLLTMKLLSEEVRSGTIETLMTAPITETQVILGKFLGAWVFFLALLAGTGVYLGLMIAYGQPDPGVAAMGYLGMVLLGAAFLAVGLFASSLTRHQAVADITAMGILAVLTFGMQLLAMHGPDALRSFATRLNMFTYLREFFRGVFDLRGAVFLLSVTALFLFLSVKSLESRRWR
ncbi:MAG: ABC transporter permease [Planctomycetota bacterium]